MATHSVTSSSRNPIRTIATRVTRPRIDRATAPDLAEDLRRAHTLSGWLDTRFSLFGFRFGLDTVIGLIPGVGDTAMTLVGLYPLYVARRHKLGRRVQARMALNLGIDWLVGLVPLVGDLFDMGYKANARNAKLLAKAAAKKL